MGTFHPKGEPDSPRRGTEKHVREEERGFIKLTELALQP